jgi:hypothetical protein
MPKSDPAILPVAGRVEPVQPLALGIAEHEPEEGPDQGTTTTPGQCPPHWSSPTRANIDPLVIGHQLRSRLKAH